MNNSKFKVRKFSSISLWHTQLLLCCWYNFYILWMPGPHSSEIRISGLLWFYEATQ